MMRVLLTGANSPLGEAVAAALAAAGHTARATDTTPLPGRADDAAGPDYHQGALTEPAFVAPLLEGAGAVVHLAPLVLLDAMPAEAPGDILDAATRGTHVLLKAAVDAGVLQIVQGSTLAVMEAYDRALEVTEQWRPRPRPEAAHLAPYLAELVAREFTRDVQIAAPPSVVCLRFARLTGSAGHTTPEGTALDPDSLHVSDAAQAVLRALDALGRGARQRGHRWQLYHVASPAPGARYTSAAARQALGYASEGAVAP
jgi:nucleoside-diphosphate-sugar epimerase